MKRFFTLGLILILLLNVVNWEGVEAAPVSKKAFCFTPPSIMLHSKDGVWSMNWLVETIENLHLRPMTYRQVSELWQKQICPPSNTILVSLDDLGTSWLQPAFKDMIKVFTDKGYALTLGVITGLKDEDQNTEIWAYLRDLEEKGVEIASHAAQQPDMAKINAAVVRKQAEVSYNMLCKHLGKCPVTFILPGGRGGDSSEKMAEISRYYTNVVSIPAPRIYFGRTLLFKRIPLVMDENDQSLPALWAPYFLKQKNGTKTGRGLVLFE